MTLFNPISSKDFIVRLADPSDTVSRAVRRVVVNSEVLKTYKLCAGDVIALIRVEESADAQNAFSIGLIWPSLEIPPINIFVSPSLLLTADVQEGSRIQIYPLTGKIPSGIPSLRQAREAGAVRLQDLSRHLHNISSGNEVQSKRQDWLSLLLKESLVDLKYITSTQILEVQYEGQIRRFRVNGVSEQYNSYTAASLAADLQSLSLDRIPQLWVVGWDTLVTIEDQDVKEAQGSDKEVDRTVSSPTADAYSSVGGLEKQITQIKDLIEIPLTRPELFRHFGLKPPRGILLHGPPGTGKTHLARAIALSTNSSIIIVNGPELSSAYHGETEARIRDVFTEARAKSPCIVVLDEVDALCPKREDGPGGEVEKRVVATLLTIMDGMEDDTGVGNRVVVVATTNRPNAIDPALRRPGRFDREIEIGIPDAEARFSILQVLLSKTPHKLNESGLRAVASTAHGYVGADLSAVVREAGTMAIKRWLTASAPLSISSSTSEPELLLSDLLGALPSIRPSALRSVFLELAPIRYSDIGGQGHVIEKLKETVEWPLKHPGTFARLGAKAPKGVLLYGPPGCSKTLLVRACATESGINFVAIKGPELLNKYIGESERAVRETFRKARAASPCIVFFDEIDALASSRSSTSSSDGGSNEGVLISLLNEMDGVQELVGVIVVAATNRPEVIDSALLRPGRLDRLLYVGPPDARGREEILKIRLAKMSVEPGLDITSLAALTEGCSGAEIVAMCQEAALLTMKEDMGAEYVSNQAFITAAQGIKRQITPAVVASFELWKNRNSG